MIIDSHAHLNFKAFKDDWEEVIEDCLKQNIWMINVGSKLETSQRAVEIAESYKQGVFAAVGVHPIHAKEGFNEEAYKKIATSPKVVAIGEVGLDNFNHYGEFLEEQKELLKKQIRLAMKLGKPLIIHCRKAHQELLEVLRESPRLPAVIHCFTGTWRLAQEYLEMGYFLGINGIIYKLNLKEVISKTPLDGLLLETDCPYLGKSEERNDPRFVFQIAEEIAKIKNIPVEEVVETTTENTRKLFGI